jgi:hypothetical protein
MMLGQENLDLEVGKCVLVADTFSSLGGEPKCRSKFAQNALDATERSQKCSSTGRRFDLFLVADIPLPSIASPTATDDGNLSFIELTNERRAERNKR